MTNIGTGYKQGNEWLCNDMPRREWTYSCIKQYHEIRAHLLCSKITTNYKWPNGTGHKTKVLIYNEMPTILLTNVSTTHTHTQHMVAGSLPHLRIMAKHCISSPQVVHQEPCTAQQNSISSPHFQPTAPYSANPWPIKAQSYILGYHTVSRITVIV